MTDLPSKEETLLRALKYLVRHYVGQLENARERIVFLGGDCDPVDVMESRDPHLKQVREVIASVEASSGETKAEHGIPHRSEGLTWDQFWARVREIDWNPSPRELRAALIRYEDRECPSCHKQLEDDEIIGSCLHNNGEHRRALKSGADPVYVGMDLAKPGSDSTVYFCPTCKTELAWEGDVCGLCFPVAQP